ncbi:MAG: asparaginase [Anaerolineae bacterium]|nr:asparaginase [Anaerolineae bacterium]
METLVEATRGELVESRHRGIIALVDAEGKLKSSVGDVEQYVFMRSSAKPLQLIPLIESGAADHFRFTDRELAVMMASHSGEPFHVEAVGSILAKIGLHEGALRCGIHWPMNKEAARKLRRSGQEPTAIHNNCSGKHAGMLALAVHGEHTLDNYTSPDHPVQIQIRAAIADFAGLTPEQIKIGKDGCGVPVFGLPLWRAAYAYARLVDPAAWPAGRREDCRRVVEAMQRHPEMVAGSGRFNTDLMHVGGSRLVAKGGAEGYYAVGVLPTDLHPGLGLALKIEDGDLQGRASGPVVLSCLQQIRVLQEDDMSRLGSHWSRSIYNHRGEVVGELQTTFVLLPSEHRED